MVDEDDATSAERDATCAERAEDRAAPSRRCRSLQTRDTTPTRSSARDPLAKSGRTRDATAARARHHAHLLRATHTCREHTFVRPSPTHAIYGSKLATEKRGDDSEGGPETVGSYWPKWRRRAPMRSWPNRQLTSEPKLAAEGTPWANLNSSRPAWAGSSSRRACPSWCGSLGGRPRRWGGPGRTRSPWSRSPE